MAEKVKPGDRVREPWSKCEGTVDKEHHDSTPRRPQWWIKWDDGAITYGPENLYTLIEPTPKEDAVSVPQKWTEAEHDAFMNQARQAINRLLIAQQGDSNDAETEAGHDCAELLAKFTGLPLAVSVDSVDEDEAVSAVLDIARTIALKTAEVSCDHVELVREIGDRLFEAGLRNPANPENFHYYDLQGDSRG